MTVRDLKPLLGHIVPSRTIETLTRARKHSQDWLERVRQAVDDFIEARGLPADKIVVAALGSVGRYEALDASDLDIMPIVVDDEILNKELDAALRKAVQDALGVKVSAGEDLTQRTAVADLKNPEYIGTDDDSTSRLSRRIMALTESAVAGGKLSLDEVRREILETYHAADRTSGRHVHSFCNDIARYYRTLCIEYKAKVDVHSKDWGTRNMKLRHSRKLWYFSSMLACAATADRRDDAAKRVLVELAKSPVDRIVDAVSANSERALPIAGQLLESYAWFLEFMATPEHREALAAVGHADRYKPALRNPFPVLKYNSDLLHSRMTDLLKALDPVLQQHVIAWFLL